MSFGQTIKDLRRDAGMTQEHLAELLSISPQAVSRWETDAAMPDISLLPPLANLFGVTTDHLLGMDTYQKDLRKAEFDEAFHEYLKHHEANYQIAVRAVAEYPGNMDYIEWLAFAEYDMALSLLDDVEYTRLLESSVNHYRIVLENSTDHKVLRKALFGIVLALHSLGRDDDAKKYAMKEEDEDRRNDLLCWCLSGTEKTIHNQRIAERDLNKFLSQLELASKSIEACEAVEQILKILFPDENYQYYHNILQYNALHKAFALCSEQRYDEVIVALKQSRFHAEIMVQYQKQPYYRFTAPLFNLVEGEKPECDSGVTDVDDFISCLNNNRCFDPIREREDFKALLNR
ncbi:MAG: helix-turn-helix transcriptional regulator [Ruminococcaceae bacterium]|nr:helix-turn-helix transcriptional regulator [Oscillospiraceae bacterium]